MNDYSVHDEHNEVHVVIIMLGHIYARTQTPDAPTFCLLAARYVRV